MKLSSNPSAPGHPGVSAAVHHPGVCLQGVRSFLLFGSSHLWIEKQHVYKITLSIASHKFYCEKTWKQRVNIKTTNTTINVV